MPEDTNRDKNMGDKKINKDQLPETVKEDRQVSYQEEFIQQSGDQPTIRDKGGESGR
jgi:hypothetical protein